MKLSLGLRLRPRIFELDKDISLPNITGALKPSTFLFFVNSISLVSSALTICSCYLHHGSIVVNSLYRNIYSSTSIA